MHLGNIDLKSCKSLPDVGSDRNLTMVTTYLVRRWVHLRLHLDAQVVRDEIDERRYREGRDDGDGRHPEPFLSDLRHEQGDRDA